MNYWSAAVFFVKIQKLPKTWTYFEKVAAFGKGILG